MIGICSVVVVTRGITEFGFYTLFMVDILAVAVVLLLAVVIVVLDMV